MNKDLLESQSISYSKGYKYQLRADCWLYTGIRGNEAKTEYIHLQENGWMKLKKGYAWDGASGPTIDTKSSMRGSAGHDALYQLCRLGFLPKSLQPEFDALLEEWSLADGMWKIRAMVWEKILNRFGRANLYPSKEKPILRAP